MYIRDCACCGVKEIANLREYHTTKEAMQDFCRHNLRWGKLATCRHVFFTQATGDNNEKYGNRFAAFILKHNLGSVVRTKGDVNPNSGNYLIMWVWTVNWKATKNWWKENGGGR